MTASLAAFQADFAAALRDPSPDAAPACLSAVAARRFRVYRNNTRVALVEALAASYPAVRRIVGAPFFERMARVYVEDRPARDRTLNLYGDGFADFVAGFAPARDLPYLPDVARLERAAIEARHAADATPLDPAEAAALGDGIATALLTPHPAARLVRSAWPITDIRRANVDDDAPVGDFAFAVGATAGALVLRPRLSVSVAALAPGRCAFAGVLLAGGRPADAQAAAAFDENFDIVAAFGDLLAGGAFAGVAVEPREGERT